MNNSYYSESNEDDENFKDIFMNIGIHLHKQFINSDSDSESDSEIKREKLFNIGMYMHDLSFPNEINYNEIMNKVFQELLVVTVKNNYISDTDDEFFYLSEDEY